MQKEGGSVSISIAMNQRQRKIKWRTILLQQCVLLLSYLVITLEAVPIDVDKTKVKEHTESETVENPDTGLYYDTYLRQVIDVLETDKHFREKLQTADIEEIKSGKLSKELDLVSHHVRTRLDELKRQEVARLRMLIKAKIDSFQDTGIDHQALLKQFEHLNHHNPHTFEAKDLDMLIKAATHDLENYDKSRHEEFKKYEMMKEHERREYLKTLDEEKRRQEESKFEEMKKKHSNHPKINHPGSKDQLKEVWEETDGLDPNDFDPKTFFKLHDVNADGFLDEQELEALFTKELEKVYDPKNEEDDMIEMEEERLRMREHVMNEVDINKDRLVTLEEFMRVTEKKEFLEPESWETLDQQQIFSEEELKEFESHISQQEDELKKKSEELQKQKEELQRQQDHLEAQRQEFQQVVQQMEQKKLQQGHPPSGPGGELKFQPPGTQAVNAQNHPIGGSQPLPPGNIPIQEAAAKSDHVQTHP